MAARPWWRNPTAIAGWIGVPVAALSLTLAIFQNLEAVCQLTGRLCSALSIGDEAQTGVFRGPLDDTAITVAPFRSLNSGEEAQYYAESVSLSVADAIGRRGVLVVASRRDGGDASGAARTRYQIEGDVRRDGGIVHVVARLVDNRNGATLFTQSFEAPEAEAAGVPARVSARVAFWGATPGQAADPQFISEQMQIDALWDRGERMAAYEHSRSFARRYPDNAIAQLYLAFNTGYAYFRIPSEEFPEAIAAALAAEERARALAPRVGEIYTARSLLIRRQMWAEREAWLRRGLEVDPEAPSVSTFLAQLYLNVGRIEDAGRLMEGAVARDPLNPYKVSTRLFILLVQGERTKAQELQTLAERYFPNNREVILARLEGGRLAGPNSDIAALLGEPAAAAVIEPDAQGPIHLVARALQTRRAGDVQAAVAGCRAANLQTQIGASQCLVGLSALGRLDEAFATAERVFPDTFGLDAEDERRVLVAHGRLAPDVLFVPEMAAFRADPRFADVVESRGILTYWRQSGRAPDFCQRERAPVCAQLQNR